MDLHKAQWMTRTLMHSHGLIGWTFAWTKKTSLLGQCSHHTKQIFLSLSWTHSGDEARVRNTILHEIAHAIVGPRHGHDEVWREKAVSLGCTGERCTTYTHDRPQKRYVLSCLTHGEIGQKEKMGKRRYSCIKCCPHFDSRFLLKWSYNQKYEDQKYLIDANRPR